MKINLEVEKQAKILFNNIKTLYNQVNNIQTTNLSSPYFFSVNLNKNVIDFFERQEKKEYINKNLIVQFWEILKWMIKQAKNPNGLLWIDFHGDCENIGKKINSYTIFSSENKNEFDNSIVMKLKILAEEFLFEEQKTIKSIDLQTFLNKFPNLNYFRLDFVDLIDTDEKRLEKFAKKLILIL